MVRHYRWAFPEEVVHGPQHADDDGEATCPMMEEEVPHSDARPVEEDREGNRGTLPAEEDQVVPRVRSNSRLRSHAADAHHREEEVLRHVDEEEGSHTPVVEEEDRPFHHRVMACHHLVILQQLREEEEDIRNEDDGGGDERREEEEVRRDTRRVEEDRPSSWRHRSCEDRHGDGRACDVFQSWVSSSRLLGVDDDDMLLDLT
mmetsp:Transcript_5092/g.11574  ORF Transcript_5092/g.11574 Transcript_5092/m.11574 type:complete len:203 (+) Transcript_5092:2455-3063(+)